MAHVIEITDWRAPELDLFARLTEGQLRSRREPEKGIFIAESAKVIGHALDSGCQPIALLMGHKHLEGAGRALIERCGEVPVYTADDQILTALTGYHLTRGMLCAMGRPVLPRVEKVCAGARRIAVLEGIVDATNVGAIFRSAAALDLDGVLVTPTCCDPLHRRAVRVSMGTVFQIPWTYFHKKVSWPEAGMEQLRSLGFKTVAMALRNDSISIDAPALQAEEKLAIILGAEGDGLVDATITGCDYTVKIPMSHEVDSLNVAAASAVAFWELGKR